MDKVALVTGANQGLGFALVKGLGQMLSGRSTVYLTARNRQRGQAALETIATAAASVRFELLDVTQENSVAGVAEQIRQRHGGIDLVISNAAARISTDQPPNQQVRTFVDTNNHGTTRMLRYFLPLLKENARFITVASSFGSLRHLAAHLHAHFEVKSARLADMDAVMDRYVASVEAGKQAVEGWPEWINIPSKIGQVAATKIAARMIAEQRPNAGILINAACPGLVDTDASRPWFNDMSAALSPDDAAKDLLWLANLPPGTTAPQGELVQFRQILPWLPDGRISD